jgi:hypothetical protein
MNLAFFILKQVIIETSNTNTLVSFTSLPYQSLAQNSQMSPNAQRSLWGRHPKFLVKQQKPKWFGWTPTAHKSLQTRKRKGKDSGAPIKENSPRSDFRAPIVQMLLFLPYQMMVKSSWCWPKWKDKKRNPWNKNSSSSSREPILSFFSIQVPLAANSY